MPRGRYWYGPGFWKRGTGWVPGSGGFRGGAYTNSAAAAAGFYPGWFGPCHRYGAGYFPYPPWMLVPEPEPEEEADYLKQQAEAVRSELEEIEKKLADLENEQKSQ